MKLKGLLEYVNYDEVQGDFDINIKDIQHDSRQVTEGSLFVCIPGYEADGHSYIKQAIDNGAAAIITTKKVEVEDDNIPVALVKDSREAIAQAATKYYNKPTSQFELIGVTGTNGKTSTVFLVDSILRKAKKKTGLIGTIENRIGDKILKAYHTTPDALELQNIFAQMVEANVNDVVMEVSSHALELKRVEGTEFDVAVFTNLTLDHLDFHKTMEVYRDAKLKLFNLANKIVINIDDLAGEYIIENSEPEVLLTYSIKDPSADLYGSNCKIDINGATFDLEYEEKKYSIKIQTPGIFSIYNAIAAIGAALEVGISIEVSKEALAENSKIEGRFETIKNNKGYLAVIDYAHAPDGLAKVLETIEEFVEGDIITVFGCGGDRDKSKRPIMGKVAGEHSDKVIITSDNPRTEEPEQIIDEIEEGIKETKCSYKKITDRVEAIRYGLELAKPGDIVLVAGKGHEDYQVIGKVKIHMDDREIVKTYLKEAEVEKDNS